MLMRNKGDSHSTDQDSLQHSDLQLHFAFQKAKDISNLSAETRVGADGIFCPPYHRKPGQVQLFPI